MCISGGRRLHKFFNDTGLDEIAPKKNFFKCANICKKLDDWKLEIDQKSKVIFS